MMSNINNQELKHAEYLKNNWKLNEALKILDNLTNSKDFTTQERFQFYFLKASILVDIFNSKEAVKFADLAYKENKKSNSDYNTIRILLLKCHIFASLLEPTYQLEMINEAEEILTRINQKFSQEFKLMKGHVLLSKGCYYFGIGDLNSCLSFLSEASQLAYEINDKNLIVLISKWLGFTYNVKGESDCALEYKKRYLELAIELKDIQEIIGAHNTLGMEFTEKGEFNEAIEHLEKGLSLCYKINSWKTFVVSGSLFHAYLKGNYLDQALECHDQMGKLVEQGTYKFNEVAYRLQEAELLKRKPDEISRTKAEKIFKEVADKETTFIEFKVEALLNVCDLYLTRLKETCNLNELDKIQPYINKIRFIAENEELYSLLAELYLLQAKLSLLTFEFQEAQEFLNQSLEIANSKGLNLIVRRIDDEQTELSKNFLKWENLRKSGGKISERMNLAQVDKQIQILLQKRNYLKTVISS